PPLPGARPLEQPPHPTPPPAPGRQRMRAPETQAGSRWSPAGAAGEPGAPPSRAAQDGQGEGTPTPTKGRSPRGPQPQGSRLLTPQAALPTAPPAPSSLLPQRDPGVGSSSEEQHGAPGPAGPPRCPSVRSAGSGGGCPQAGGPGDPEAGSEGSPRARPAPRPRPRPRPPRGPAPINSPPSTEAEGGSVGTPPRSPVPARMPVPSRAEGGSPRCHPESPPPAGAPPGPRPSAGERRSGAQPSAPQPPPSTGGAARPPPPHPHHGPRGREGPSQGPTVSKGGREPAPERGALPTQRPGRGSPRHLSAQGGAEDATRGPRQGAPPPRSGQGLPRAQRTARRPQVSGPPGPVRGEARPPPPLQGHP
uniref:Uncharacterized protein n=1 Tax=Mustela putorius furo TaxID=9669 RepID=M3YJ25_MUSPF